MRVWLASGPTDMRRGMNSLALQVQQALKLNPHGGDLFVFRGKRGHLLKVLWADGIGLSLYIKRLERGRFIWPAPVGGVVPITRRSAGLHAGRHRLALAAAHLAAAGGGIAVRRLNRRALS